ncbi:4'-phosphopantetheinyl transferase family protein [Novosphingobium resinovorum]|uniref:4'-phosphopantetheinyl transferase family protein n=1 Tax=Novosphingobium resinovorum TaxID=158500 RepID=UPI002ED69C81|nr:4'-phosphopantetheinyl transferase superfamily protein [Novosphingobium resinovorum]
MAPDAARDGPGQDGLAQDGATGALLQAHGIAAERLEAPFALWLVRAGQEGDRRALAACLGPAERARAERFGPERLAHRYRAAHAALRLLVQARFGIDAGRQDYGANAHGKPFLRGAPEVQCNISYSGDFALVAVGTGRQIGIDLERVRPVADAAQLAFAHYTDREIAGLAAHAGAGAAAALDRAFLTVWVRKEACSKALGKGLSIPPSSFECGLGCGLRNVLIEGEIVESVVSDPKGGLLMSWARRGPGVN